MNSHLRFIHGYGDCDDLVDRILTVARPVETPPRPGFFPFLSSGFTEGLLQLSFAIRIITHPIVMPFAANRRVGEIGGGGGGVAGGWLGGGQGGVTLGQDTAFACGDGTCDQFCASLPTIIDGQCPRILVALRQVMLHQQRPKQVLGITCMD